MMRLEKGRGERRGMSEVSERDVYLELKRQAPQVIENLEATVAQGIPKADILEKVREFTPGDVPQEIWTAIERSIDCIAEDLKAASEMN